MSNLMIPKINSLTAKSNIDNNDLLLIEDSQDNYSKKKILASSLLNSGGSNVYKITGVLGENINTGEIVSLENRGSGLKIYKLQSNLVSQNYWTQLRLQSFCPVLNENKLFSFNYGSGGNFNGYIGVFGIDYPYLKQETEEYVGQCYGYSAIQPIDIHNNIGIVVYWVNNTTLRIQCFKVIQENNVLIGNYVDISISAVYGGFSYEVAYYYYYYAICNIFNGVGYILVRDNSQNNLRLIKVSTDGENISLLSNSNLSYNYYPHYMKYNTNIGKYIVLCRDTSNNWYLMMFDDNFSFVRQRFLFNVPSSVENWGCFEINFDGNYIVCCEYVVIVSSDLLLRGNVYNAINKIRSVVRINNNTFLGNYYWGLWLQGYVFSYSGLNILSHSQLFTYNYYQGKQILFNNVYLGINFAEVYSVTGHSGLISLVTGDISRYIGLLELGGNAGDTRNVIIANGIHNNMNGLQPGLTYYLDYWGNLVTTPTRWKAYKALDTNKALVLY